MGSLYNGAGRADLIAAVMRTSRDKVGRWLVLDESVPSGMDPAQAAEIALMDHLFMVAHDRGGIAAMSTLLTAAIDTMHSYNNPEERRWETP